MRVVALIRWNNQLCILNLIEEYFWFSGGKDSTYNMIQCVRNGHEIVALGNLHPRKDIGLRNAKIVFFLFRL